MARIVVRNSPIPNPGLTKRVRDWNPYSRYSASCRQVDWLGNMVSMSFVKWDHQIPGHGKDVALDIELVRVSHDPVGEVLNKLVAELHLLSEGQVVSSQHHCLHQLTDLRLYLYGVNRRVQVTNVPENCIRNQSATRKDICFKFWVSTPSPRQIPRLFQVFPTEALVSIKPADIQTGLWPYV